MLMHDKHLQDRPTLGSEGAEAQEAIHAVEHLVEEPQAGWDHRDTDISNRHLAADIMWGCPFGATVRGYDELHAIHTSLKKQAKGGALSRFEIERVLAPAPGIAVAQVRRVALSPDGQAVEPSGSVAGPFSEMALYVLVRRDGAWWFAAGQNTPIRPSTEGAYQRRLARQKMCNHGRRSSSA
jgi:uncharacterized protein (TIGR02246 family)